jgi:hypothetical protein
MLDSNVGNDENFKFHQCEEQSPSKEQITKDDFEEKNFMTSEEDVGFNNNINTDIHEEEN